MAFLSTRKRSVPWLLMAERKLTDFRCESIRRTGVWLRGEKPRPRVSLALGLVSSSQ